MIKNEWLKAGIVLAILVIAGAVFWYLVIYIPQRDQAKFDYEKQQDTQAQIDKHQKDLQTQIENCDKLAQDKDKSLQTTSEQNSMAPSSKIQQHHFNQQTSICYGLMTTILITPQMAQQKQLYNSLIFLNLTENAGLANCDQLGWLGNTNWDCKIGKETATKQQFDDYTNSLLQN